MIKEKKLWNRNEIKLGRYKIKLEILKIKNNWNKL